MASPTDRDQTGVAVVETAEFITKQRRASYRECATCGAEVGMAAVYCSRCGAERSGRVAPMLRSVDRSGHWLLADWDAALMWVVAAVLMRTMLSVLVVLPMLIVNEPADLAGGVGNLAATTTYQLIAPATAVAVAVAAWLLAALPLRGRISMMGRTHRLLLVARVSLVNILVTVGISLAWPDIMSVGAAALLGVILPALVMLVAVAGAHRGIPLGRLLGSWVVMVMVACATAVALGVTLSRSRGSLMSRIADVLPQWVDLGSATLSWGFWPITSLGPSTAELVVGPSGFVASRVEPSLSIAVALGSYLLLISATAFVTVGLRPHRERMAALITAVIISAVLPAAVFLGTLDISETNPIPALAASMTIAAGIGTSVVHLWTRDRVAATGEADAA